MHKVLAILNPTISLSQRLTDSLYVMFVLAPWLSEMVLAFRLCGVFPPHRTSKRTLFAIFIFPILAKVLRLICIIAFFARYFPVAPKQKTLFGAVGTWDYKESPYVTINWLLEILDNSWVPILQWYVYLICIARLNFELGTCRAYSSGSSIAAIVSVVQTTH
jgi:hypothetical protein